MLTSGSNQNQMWLNGPQLRFSFPRNKFWMFNGKHNSKNDTLSCIWFWLGGEMCIPGNSTRRISNALQSMESFNKFIFYPEQFRSTNRNQNCHVSKAQICAFYVFQNANLCFGYDLCFGYVRKHMFVLLTRTKIQICAFDEICALVTF